MKFLLLTLLLMPSLANADQITTVSITCDTPKLRENNTELLPEEIDKYQFFKDDVYLAESSECAYSYVEAGRDSYEYYVLVVDANGLKSGKAKAIKTNLSPPASTKVEVTVTVTMITTEQ